MREGGARPAGKAARPEDRDGLEDYKDCALSASAHLNGDARRRHFAPPVARAAILQMVGDKRSGVRLLVMRTTVANHAHVGKWIFRPDAGLARIGSFWALG